MLDLSLIAGGVLIAVSTGAAVRCDSELGEVKVMDMSFDVGKVFQERLASSMGLDKYRYIMEQVSITNVAVDTDFQRTFNGFLYSKA